MDLNQSEITNFTENTYHVISLSPNQKLSRKSKGRESSENKTFINGLLITLIITLAIRTASAAPTKNSITTINSSTNFNPESGTIQIDTPRKDGTQLIYEGNPWENPCGGIFVESSSSQERISPVNKKSQFKAFKRLRETIKTTSLNLSHNKIYVGDINELFVHNSTYKFLAQIKPKSNINLARWHRNIQVYVGAISYLKQRQDQNDRSPRNEFSKELSQLLQTSRSILCQIEKTINSTQPKSKIQNHPKPNITEILKNLRTKSIERVSEIDLKFVKVRYNEIKSNMLKVINRWIREYNCNSPKSMKNYSYGSGDNSNDSVSSSDYSGTSEQNGDRYHSKMCQKVRERRQKRLEKRQNRKSNGNTEVKLQN